MKKARKYFAYAVTLIGLLLIGVALVYGFFYHTLVYRLGPPLLVIVGGLMVFLTFKMIVFFIRFKSVEEEGSGIVIFDEREKDFVLLGKKTRHILMSDEINLKKGDVYEAKTEVIQKKPFALLTVTSVKKMAFFKLAHAEVLMLGFKSEDELLGAMMKKDRGFQVSDEITMIGF